MCANAGTEICTECRADDADNVKFKKDPNADGRKMAMRITSRYNHGESWINLKRAIARYQEEWQS
jgi:hypothetical protein